MVTRYWGEGSGVTDNRQRRKIFRAPEIEVDTVMVDIHIYPSAQTHRMYDAPSEPFCKPSFG